MAIKYVTWAKRLVSRLLQRLRVVRWRFWEKSLRHLRYGVTRKKRRTQIIVSLTSYEPRLQFLSLPLRSLLKQSVKPDRILVWLSCDFDLIPPSIRRLDKWGVEFRKAPKDLKSHKKYFFAMREYPDDFVVTVDDDIVFGSNLIASLWKTHRKYPNAIVARRVHRIRFERDGIISPYDSWDYEYRGLSTPSYLLCPTSGAGTFYPPQSLHPNALEDIGIYENDALFADDLWLKYMALAQGTKVVWAPNRDLPLHSVAESQTVALSTRNVIGGGNDAVLAALEDRFHIDIERRTKEMFYPGKLNILISIVIPIYNAEKTLVRCLQSLERQYSDDCELIMINDGSTDNSLAIANEYALRFPNSLVIDKDNGGSNSAYNLGFSLARGEYLLSLDDDDELGQETLNYLREDIANARPDIIQFQVRNIVEPNGIETITVTRPAFLMGPDGIRTDIEMLENQIKTHSGKCIRRRLVDGIYFSGNPHGADTRFFIKVLARSKSIVIDPRACWIHHFSSASQSNRAHDVTFHMSWMDHIEEDINYFRSRDLTFSPPFVGLDILFSHYCLYCQQSFEEGCFDKKCARRLGYVFWKNRILFRKELRREMAKRFFFPVFISQRYARASRQLKE